MDRKKINRGFSLVELIISLTIISIVMYAAISIFINSGAKNVNVESFSVAQSLAEGKMEETLARDFLQITGGSQTNFSGDLSSYAYQIVVNYVTREALDTVWGSATDYKKIGVLISHPKLAGTISVECIRIK